MRIAWTPTARANLREIRAYIARGSPAYAELTVDRILGAVERLRDYPLSGRVIPEAKDPMLREVIVGSYRTCYRVDADRLIVLLVFHTARLLDPRAIRDAEP